MTTPNKYTVEIHIGSRVFTQKYLSESIARRCFDEVNPDGEIICDVRLWLNNKTILACKGNNA